MAKMKEFKAEVGMSMEIKGVWYKFLTAVTLEIEEGDDTNAVKQKAWDTATLEIEKQVQGVLKG